MSSSFTHEPRKRFTIMQRAKFFEDAGGRCAKCTRKITAAEDWDLDHRIPLEGGGTNDDENMQVLCSFCHDGKTATDHSMAAKGKRMAAKAFVPRRFKQKRGWR